MAFGVANTLFKLYILYYFFHIAWNAAINYIFWGHNMLTSLLTTKHENRVEDSLNHFKNVPNGSIAWESQKQAKWAACCWYHCNWSQKHILFFNSDIWTGIIGMQCCFVYASLVTKPFAKRQSRKRHQEAKQYPWGSGLQPPAAAWCCLGFSDDARVRQFLPRSMLWSQILW